MKQFNTQPIMLGLRLCCDKILHYRLIGKSTGGRGFFGKLQSHPPVDLKFHIFGLCLTAAIVFCGLSGYASAKTADITPISNLTAVEVASEIQINTFEVPALHYNVAPFVNQVEVATIDPGGTITDGVVDGTDLPRISVSSNVEQITEGGEITITVSATTAVSKDVTINLGYVIPLNIAIPTYLSQYPVIVVDYGVGQRALSAPSITINAGTISKSIPLQTTNDSEAIGDFDLEIEVLPPTGDNKYLISTTRNGFSDKVVIVDDELEMSISATNPTAKVNSDANFALVASKVPKANRTVNVRIQKSGSVSFLDNNTVTFHANLNTQTLQIPTAGLVNNDQITITVLPGSNYNVAASPNNSASVTVSDSTVPPPPITTTPEIFIGHKYPQVIEGNPAIFIIGSKNMAVKTNLTVSINVISTGSFLQKNAPSSFTLKKNNNIGNLEIPTLDDQVDEPNGNITVSISSGTGYTIATSPEHSSFVTITDNDSVSLEIAVAHVRAEVEEGSPARFALTSETIAPKVDLTINIIEARSGDFFNTSIATTLTLEKGKTFKTIQIPTVNDSGYEPDGEVTITIQSSENYAITRAPHNSATVQIKDNDVRPLKSEIHIAPRGLKVTEGEPARFIFVAEDVIPTSQLNVNIIVTLTGNFFASNYVKPTTQVFNQGDEFTYLDIPTLDDDVIDDNGSVKIEVLSGPDYYPAMSPHNVATVQVLEDVIIPRIYIQAVKTTIEEGDVAKFEIISESIAPSSNLVINLNVTQVGSYYSSNLPNEITMAGGTKKIPLNLGTVDDDIVRPDGLIKVTIKEGDGYKPVLGTGVNKSSAEITIRNTDTSVEIQVYTSTAKIAEGEIAQFELRASRAVTTTRMVNFSILVQGNYINGFTNGVKKDFVLPLVAGKQFIPFVLQAQPNELDQPNGSITFTLESGTDYNVAAAPLDSTIVIIEDDDGPPVISVSNAASVIEGSNAVFPVTAVGTSTIDIVILFSLDEGKHDFLGGRNREVAKLNAESTSTTLSVQTVADGFDESDGMITVSIDADPLTPDTYKVGSANTARVLVSDDDKPPEISITNAVEIVEGNQASFTIFATRFSSNIVTINILIENGTNDFLLGTQPKTVLLPAKQTHTTLNVNTEDDNEDEPDGDIEVIILADTQTPQTYLVGTKSTATGKVIDDDIFTFSLLPPQLRFREDEAIRFSFDASVISRRDIPVSIKLTESANYLEGGEQTKKFIVKAGERISQQSISLDDDNLIERNGTVTATILSDPSYKREGRDNFSVLIIDNDEPPLISVVAESTQVRPNSTVDFKIIAKESITSEELMIKINVNQNSNYLKWRVPKTVMLEPLMQEKLIQFSTNSRFDEVNEGRITISVLKDTSSSPKYRVNQQADEIVISVMDLSNVPRGQPNQSPRISIADSVVNSILNLTADSENGPTPTKHEEQSIPIVQIAPLSNSVEAGKVASFQLISSQQAVETLIIELSLYASSGATALPQLQFAEIPSGANETIMEIPTNYHKNAENNGFIELSILANSKYQLTKNSKARVGIINPIENVQRQQILNSVEHEIIPRLLDVSNQDSFNFVTERINSAFTGRIENSMRLSRSDNIPDFLTTLGENISNKDSVWNSILYDSSFSLNLNPDHSSLYSTSVWGVGNSLEISGKISNSNQNWNGEISSGQFGIDSTFNNSIVGIGISNSESHVKIESNNNSTVELDSRYTRFHPYFGVNFPRLNAKTKVQASVGLLSVNLNYEDFSPQRIERQTASAAVNGEKVLYSGKNKVTGGDSNVSVTGETVYAQYATDLNLKELNNIHKKYSRWRLGVDGTDNIETVKGTTVEPKLSLGLASETLFPITNWVNLEVSAGLKTTLPVGLSMTGMVESRLRKPENGSRMAYLGLIEYDYENDNLGLQLRVEPTWGETLVDQRSALLGETYLGVIGNFKENSDDFNLRSSIRYSFDFFDERLLVTPYSSILYSNKSSQEISVGQRVHVSSNFNLEFSTSHKIEPEERGENKIRFAGRMRW